MKAYVFPGQGSQYIGMGKELFVRYKSMVQLADEILGYSIEELCLNDANKQLGLTQYTQPALYIVNAMSYRQKIENSGVTPDFLAGHSLGEYNALTASGSLTFEDGLKIVKKRGELMSLAPKGAMAAILGSTEDVISELFMENELNTIDIANSNSHDQTIISGLESDMIKAQQVFSENKIKYIPLNTSGPFHSRYMYPASIKFVSYLNDFNFSPLKIQVISNVFAKPYTQDQIYKNLTSQIVSPVKWLDSICYLIKMGVTDFEEIGVGNVLSTLIDNIKNNFKSNLIETNVLNDYSKQESSHETIDDESIETTTTKYTHTKNINKKSYTVETWNSQHEIGTKVKIKICDDVLKTRTRAMFLFDNKATIYIEGLNGYFDLSELTPI